MRSDSAPARLQLTARVRQGMLKRKNDISKVHWMQMLRDNPEHVDIHPDDGTYDYAQLLDSEHPERLRLFHIPTRVVCWVCDALPQDVDAEGNSTGVRCIQIGAGGLHKALLHFNGKQHTEKAGMVFKGHGIAQS